MTEELSILSLKCSNCAAPLQVSKEMQNFSCGFCGALLIVERKGGTVSLKLVADAVAKVQVGTDKTAAELAIQRLTFEIAQAEKNLNYSKDELENALTSQTMHTVYAIAGGLIGAICLIISIILMFTKIAACVLFFLPVGGIALLVAAFFGLNLYSSSKMIKKEKQAVVDQWVVYLNYLKNQLAQNREVVDH